MTTHDTLQAMLDRAETKCQLLKLDETKWLCRLALQKQEEIEHYRRKLEEAEQFRGKLAELSGKYLVLQQQLAEARKLPAAIKARHEVWFTNPTTWYPDIVELVNAALEASREE